MHTNKSTNSRWPFFVTIFFLPSYKTIPCRKILIIFSSANNCQSRSWDVDKPVVLLIDHCLDMLYNLQLEPCSSHTACLQCQLINISQCVLLTTVLIHCLWWEFPWNFAYRYDQILSRKLDSDYQDAFADKVIYVSNNSLKATENATLPRRTNWLKPRLSIFIHRQLKYMTPK